MDVNGTHFHLLLGEADWGRCSVTGDRTLSALWEGADRDKAPLAYDLERDEITLAQKLFEFRPNRERTPIDLSARRGGARDRYGNWYWVDAGRRSILVNSSGSGETTRFWAPEDQPPDASTGLEGSFGPAAAPPSAPSLGLGGMTVTEDHYLVVGVGDPSGLLIFDLQGGGGPEHVRWPTSVPFSPFDLAPRPDGGVFVLDVDQRTVWELDRSFSVVPCGGASAVPPSAPVGFGPIVAVASEDEGAGAGKAHRFRAPVASDAMPLGASAAGGPAAVDALPDGTVIVLFQDDAARTSSVAAYRQGELVAQPVELPNPDPASFLPGHDMAAIPTRAARADDLTARLFVADRRGDQAFEYRLRLSATSLQVNVQPRYYPMRLFGGKGLVAGDDLAYYDLQDRWNPLVEQPRQRHIESAVLATDPFDGQEPGCVWHRLMLDAFLPPETSVRVWSAASDDADSLRANPDWSPEPPLYARADGPELPWVQGDPARRFRTWELLFQRATGRFLRLKLEFAGNGQVSPRVRALRAHYPRFSYVENYLPDVYRENKDSASFLDRFLANLEGFYTSIEDRIAGAQVLIDPRTVPGDALAWLGRWFDLAMDPAWNEGKRRLLIQHALKFFQWRGTRRGLQTALALAMDEEVDEHAFSDDPDACVRRARIIEQYQTKQTPGVALGDPTQAAQAPPPPSGRWRPKDGPDDLHLRYRDALTQAGVPVGPEGVFPIAAPPSPDAAGVWSSFAREALGFVPTADPDDLPSWRDFLAWRYGSAAVLGAAYQLTGADKPASFDQVAFPTALPTRNPALTDWFQFQSVVLASRRTAHRFRVLLPVPAKTRRAVQAPSFLSGQQDRLELARRIVELEKPAHTVFDVKFYWEAFRVGEARLGLDTLVDLGGRSPNLLPGAVLGLSFVGETVLASASAATEATRRPLLPRRYR